MELWNNGKLQFSKTKLANIFKTKIDYRVNAKIYGYENKQWMQKGIKLWETLPENLSFKLKLTNTSINLLYAVYYVNLPLYTKYGWI